MSELPRMLSNPSARTRGPAAACVALTLLLLAGACSSDKKPTQAPVSRRERDSLIGASSLPGARGVRGALSAQDSAARRKARLDSIARADSQ